FVPSKREVRTFYADAYNGVCGSTKEPVNINIERYPDVSNIKMDTICKGEIAQISAYVPYGNIEWYDASNGGNLLGSGETLNDPAASTTIYYIQTSSDVCVSPSREMALVTVNDYPKFTKLWGDTICSKNSARLRAITDGPGTVKWFEFDTSTIELASGANYTTQVLGGNKSYYARTEYAGCIGPKTLVQPLVRNSPFSGFIFDVLTWQQVRVTPINSAGSSVFWSFGDGFTSTKYSVTHRYENTGQYDIKLVLTSLSNGCKDSTTVNVDITESSINRLSSLPALNIYPNPNAGQMYINADKLEGTYKVDIYDIRGVLVKSVNMESQSGKLSIDVNTLSAGIYTLVIEGYKPVMFVKA
ncbi:MAG: T9SS type A sorting domain-containing protein, partial [Bacteroidetes bacterium]|nr:T9SS type A sorting domain-containing protein [Bacteroidota bacterium]